MNETVKLVLLIALACLSFVGFLATYEPLKAIKLKEDEHDIFGDRPSPPPSPPRRTRKNYPR